MVYAQEEIGIELALLSVFYLLCPGPTRDSVHNGAHPGNLFNLPIDLTRLLDVDCPLGYIIIYKVGVVVEHVRQERQLIETPRGVEPRIGHNACENRECMDIIASLCYWENHLARFQMSSDLPNFAGHAGDGIGRN